MGSDKLLLRLLKEQCIMVGSPNPSDPDATYDGHKGNTRWKRLSLITHVAVEKAHIPAIEKTEEVPADSLYGSDDTTNSGSMSYHLSWGTSNYLPGRVCSSLYKAQERPSYCAEICALFSKERVSGKAGEKRELSPL